jgi:hypothetical protein
MQMIWQNLPAHVPQHELRRHIRAEAGKPDGMSNIGYLGEPMYVRHASPCSNFEFDNTYI